MSRPRAVRATEAGWWSSLHARYGTDDLLLVFTRIDTALDGDTTRRASYLASNSKNGF